MNVFKRLCLLVFSLCGAFCLAALALPWLGPWTKEATGLLSVQWYYLAVEVSFCVVALGMLVSLARALFTPRNRRAVMVERAGGDAITVTTTALSAQAAHIVEASGDYTAARVRVVARKRAVRVAVRVQPRRPTNIVEEGPRLHGELVDGLTALAGDALSSVELEFVESASQGLSASEYDAYLPGPDVASLASSAPTNTDEPVSPPHERRAVMPGVDVQAGITVPMGHVSADTSTLDGDTPDQRGE